MARLLSSGVETTELNVDAFLFDMDGTLVDSGAVVESAWAQWAREYNLDLTEILAYSHGRPTLATMDHFGSRFAPDKNWQAEADAMLDFETSHGEGTLAIGGALELLQQLIREKAPWAVVTSAPRKLAESRIQAAGLPLPKVLVPVDEITNGKPHPEGFLKAASQLNVQPGRCVVVEDTVPGVEAGLSAGMPVIGILTTVSAERLRTPHAIRNYFDLAVTRNGDSFAIRIKP